MFALVQFYLVRYELDFFQWHRITLPNGEWIQWLIGEFDPRGHPPVILIWVSCGIIVIKLLMRIGTIWSGLCISTRKSEVVLVCGLPAEVGSTALCRG